MPSLSVDVVTSMVYGTAATIIGVVTIYQSYVAWRLWHEHHHTSRQSSSGAPDTSLAFASKIKLCLLLRTDVELALGSALVVRPEPSNTASTNVAPVHDTDNLQPVANDVEASVHDTNNLQPVTNDVEASVHDTDNLQPVVNVQPVANDVTAPASSQQLGVSDNSTTDLEPIEVENESQATAIPGIDPDAASTLLLQPLQTPEFDVVPVHDTISTQAVANLKDSSVSYPTSNPPNTPPSPDIPVHTTGRS